MRAEVYTKSCLFSEMSSRLLYCATFKTLSFLFVNGFCCKKTDSTNYVCFLPALLSNGGLFVCVLIPVQP